MENNKSNVYIKHEENESFTDICTVTSSLDSNKTSPLTSSEKAELNVLRNLSDEDVRKEAETDPDCEPLE